MTLIVKEDEFWPWRYFPADDEYGYAVGVLEVDTATAERWRKVLEDAESVQDEINAALVAKYPPHGRSLRGNR